MLSFVIMLLFGKSGKNSSYLVEIILGMDEYKVELEQWLRLLLDLKLKSILGINGIACLKRPRRIDSGPATQSEFKELNDPHVPHPVKRPAQDLTQSIRTVPACIMAMHQRVTCTHR